MKYWMILAALLAACSDAPLKKGPGTPDVDMNEADQAEDMSELDMEDMAFPDMPHDMGLDDMDSPDMEVDFAQPDMPDDMEPDLPPVIDPAGDEDSDGLTNEEEGAPGRDTDGDGIPDYLDLDSDNDGLSDADELAAGTSPVVSDTDGDGEWDVLEVNANTDPLDDSSNLKAQGIVVVMMAPDQPRLSPVDVSLKPRIQDADVYLSMDASGSMFDDFQVVKQVLQGVHDSLLCEDNGTNCVADEQCNSGMCSLAGFCVDSNLPCVERSLHWGFGRWVELDSFQNVSSVNGNIAATVAAIDPGSASGAYESITQPIACVADGVNCTNSNKNCAAGGVGCGGFRPAAFKTYLHISDAREQCDDSSDPAYLQRCSTFTPTFAGSELARQNINFAALYDDTDTGTSNPTPATTLNAVALAAGSVDSQGLPFVYSWAASGFGAMLPLAIRGVLERHQFEARGAIVEQGGDAGDIGDFLVRIEADTTTNGCAALPTEDSDNDTYPETFPAVVAGTNLCWKLEFAPNTLVPRTSSLQEIRGSFQTQGADGTTASRPLLLIVPPIVGQP